MQEPLKKELTDGVAIFKQDVINFDFDFELNGPMVEGIPAKEASDRYHLRIIHYFATLHVFKTLML